MNLCIGISLAFVFVFSFEVLKIVASGNNSIPPLLAMWLPNIVFGALAFYLTEESESIKQFYFFVEEFL